MNQSSEGRQIQDATHKESDTRHGRLLDSVSSPNHPRSDSQRPAMIHPRPLLSPIVDRFRIRSPERSPIHRSDASRPYGRLTEPLDLPWQLPPLSRHHRTYSLADTSGRPRQRSPEHSLYPYKQSRGHNSSSPLFPRHDSPQHQPYPSHRPSHARSHSHAPGPSQSGGNPPSAQAYQHQYNSQQSQYQQAFQQPPQYHSHAQHYDHSMTHYHHHQYRPSTSSTSSVFLPPLASPVDHEEATYSPLSESSSKGSAPHRPLLPSHAHRRSSTGAYSHDTPAPGPSSGDRDLSSAARFNFKREILTRNGMTIGSWTREESAELMALVDGFKQVEPDNTIPWTRIGRQLRHPRTGAQCHAHYTEALDPKILKGRWNAELDAELIRLAALHDNSWVKVSADLPNKTQRQCRSRWVALLRKKERDEAKAGAVSASDEATAAPQRSPAGEASSIAQQAVPPPSEGSSQTDAPATEPMRARLLSMASAESGVSLLSAESRETGQSLESQTNSARTA